MVQTALHPNPKSPSRKKEREKKKAIKAEKWVEILTFLGEIKASEGRPTAGQLSISCLNEGGLVVATPWDANMDAEQKLKGEPAWIGG